MSTRHVLAIDQGTTNTKVLLFDEHGAVVSRAEPARRHRVPAARAGSSRTRAALWQTVEDAIDECLARVPATPGRRRRHHQPAGVRPRVGPRHRARRSGPSSCGSAAARRPSARRCGATAHAPLLEPRTGLTIDPLFSASKIRWLLDTLPDGRRRAAAGELCAGTIDSWLLWNLTGGARARLRRDQRVAHAAVQPADARLGRRAAGDLRHPASAAARRCGRRAASSARRSRAAASRPACRSPARSAIRTRALFGHAAFAPGSVKATYGTGSSLMTPTAGAGRARGTGCRRPSRGRCRPARPTRSRATSPSPAAPSHWLGRPARPAGRRGRRRRPGAHGRPIPDGVYLVPALAGLGAPYWDAEARGLLCGATRGTTAAHVARATIDVDRLPGARRVRRDARGRRAPRRSLLADGGASRNDDLMQFQADILGCPVVRSDSTDLSARGAAWLAGLAVGIWPSTRRARRPAARGDALRAEDGRRRAGPALRRLAGRGRPDPVPGEGAVTWPAGRRGRHAERPRSSWRPQPSWRWFARGPCGRSTPPRDGVRRRRTTPGRRGPGSSKRRRGPPSIWPRACRRPPSRPRRRTRAAVGVRHVDGQLVAVDRRSRVGVARVTPGRRQLSAARPSRSGRSSGERRFATRSRSSASPTSPTSSSSRPSPTRSTSGCCATWSVRWISSRSPGQSVTVIGAASVPPGAPPAPCSRLVPVRITIAGGAR